MAIFAFGANYGGMNDVSCEFIKRGVACVGWPPNESPTLHTILKYIKTGDVVYIKAQPGNVGLIMRAVGIVVGNELKDSKHLGVGVRVDWVWTGEERLSQIKDKCRPMHNLALYEEHNFAVQKR